MAKPALATPPLGALRFLYVGCADVGAALGAYAKAGAQVVWDHTAFGTRVAAVRTGPDPLILLAGHRPSPSLLPVYQVFDLAAVIKTLRRAGWHVEGEAFEIPNGPCRLVKDPAGNEFALFEDVRPDAFA